VWLWLATLSVTACVTFSIPAIETSEPQCPVTEDHL
jgi:hypothetical protein